MVVVLVLDDGQKLSVEPDTVVELNLHAGDNVTEGDLENIKSEDEKKKCMAKALRLLAVRPRSEFEINDQLKRSGYSTAAIGMCLDYLHEKSYLNDDQFALQWAKRRIKKKPMGSASLKFELKKKGISDDRIQKVIAELFSGESEFEKALAAGRKKMPAHKKSDAATVRRKLYLFLSQRGFAPDTIKQVTDALLK